MTKWNEADIPAQRGRSAVVTGTGGLGLETALALARAGCDVIIAGRNPEKGADAVSRIQRAVPQAAARFEKLDLADLSSVASFAQRMENDRESLDLLVNNAGIMVPPNRQETRDGFELQFGTNYLGHFALTAHLMSLLRKRTDTRVVTVSSVAARAGKINFDDINSEKHYRPMEAYSQSKLACLMFALELHERSQAAGRVSQVWRRIRGSLGPICCTMHPVEIACRVWREPYSGFCFSPRHRAPCHSSSPPRRKRPNQAAIMGPIVLVRRADIRNRHASHHRLSIASPRSSFGSSPNV